MANHSQFGSGGTDARNPVDCSTFETLLFDALDGLLSADKTAEFRRHAADCTICGPMFADVERGYVALHSLSEVDPPDHLVHNIMARTAYADSGAAVKIPGTQPEQGLRSRLRGGILHPVLQPRFAMSMGMAFFSLTLILNVAGISRQDLKELRPATAMVKLNEVEGRVLKYYENLRAVYLFVSFMRDVQQNQTEPEKPKPQDGKPKPKGSETSQTQPMQNKQVAKLICPSESQPLTDMENVRTLA
ncbi:MAG: hypothetical protein NVS9B15_18860 [Acidobacteriaceae bacterium]